MEKNIIPKNNTTRPLNIFHNLLFQRPLVPVQTAWETKINVEKGIAFPTCWHLPSSKEHPTLSDRLESPHRKSADGAGQGCGPPTEIPDLQHPRPCIRCQVVSTAPPQACNGPMTAQLEQPTDKQDPSVISLGSS
ncbi:hypothetical protein RRG08_065849 [Elysia crispata]|uniref:Uncharacterized protein n=1 Tax=Elysia crispata TaxID=231223 RepID=A0AAE0ZC27_9GAST|nr:hypothetical protein RRG08_065849 [Elysia crispata]